MRSGRQAFALMLTLVVVAALFALAMHGAVVARTTALEASSLATRVSHERDARVVAFLALNGLLPGTPTDSSSDLADSSDSSSSDAPDAPAEESVELPAFIKALIPELADIEDQARDATQDSGGAALVAGAPARSRPRVSDLISAVGIPSTPLRIEYGGTTYRVTCIDALGLLDVNRAEARQLRAFLEAKDFTPDEVNAITDQILDWRDEDGVVRSAGAEQETYDELRVTCRNGTFATVEELLYLPAITPEVFHRLRDDVMLGGDGKAHVGTSPVAVLASLPGMSEPVLERLLALREQSPITPEMLERALPVTGDAMAEMLRLEPSGLVRILVEADDGTGRAFEGLASLGNDRIRMSELRPRR